MPETTIVRSEIVVVDTIDSNSYGDMLFTDKAGNNIINIKLIQFQGITQNTFNLF